MLSKKQLYYQTTTPTETRPKQNYRVVAWVVLLLLVVLHLKHHYGRRVDEDFSAPSALSSEFATSEFCLDVLGSVVSNPLITHHGETTTTVSGTQSQLPYECLRAHRLLKRIDADELYELAARAASRAHLSDAIAASKHILDRRANESDDFVIQSDVLPNVHYRPEVGSGVVATVVGSDTLYAAGVFNGAKGESHRARIPALTSFRIKKFEASSGILYATSHTYQLDMANGYFVQLTEVRSGGLKFSVAHRTYAHRQLAHVLVEEVEVVRVTSAEVEEDGINRSVKDASFKLVLDATCKNDTSDDFDFREIAPPLANTRARAGRTRTAEIEGVSLQNVVVLHDVLPQELEVSGTAYLMRWTFLTSVADDNDTCYREYKTAKFLIASGSLLEVHRRAWQSIWGSGSLTLTTSSAGLEDGAAEKLRESVVAGQYYLLSSLKTSIDGVAYALSPGGLAHGALNPHDYLGHAFWDQETWMYPPLLLMHGQWAKRLLEYRAARLAAALKNAQHWGNTGAQFPWESAHTGLEVCPGDRWARYQIHVSADISLAFMQYIYMSNDTEWYFRPVPTAVDIGNTSQSSEAAASGSYSPYEVVLEVARFWSKRAILNSLTGLYEVHGVMPPDEWHWNVSNSVYTNLAAGVALRAPYDLWTFTRPSRRVPEELVSMKTMGEKMFVLYDAENKYHPEFDGYRKGEVVLQADVTMLNYPLLYNGSDMNLEVMRNDLLFYEPAISISSPAMTWPMFSTGWLALRRFEGADEKEVLVNANRLLRKSLLYIQPPFKIWTEGYFGLGCVNFLTGYGGYLQNYLNGFLGIRIRRDRLEFDPILPDGVNEISLVFNYMRCKIQFHTNSQNFVVKLTECSAKNSLVLYMYNTHERISLQVNEEVQRPVYQFAILH